MEFKGSHMHGVLVRLTYVALLFSQVVTKVTMGSGTNAVMLDGRVFTDTDLMVRLWNGETRRIRVEPAEPYQFDRGACPTAIVRTYYGSGRNSATFTPDTLQHMTFDADFVRRRCGELSTNAPRIRVDIKGILALLGEGAREISCLQLLRAAGYVRSVAELEEFEFDVSGTAIGFYESDPDWQLQPITSSIH